MLAALTAEDVLAADETPVNVLDKAVPQPAAPDEAQEEKDPGEKEKAAGAPHVLIVRTPDGRLTWLQAIASRRKTAIAAGIPAAFAGWLITDGYTGYQHLLARLAGIQQCCQHVIRRCRAVTKLGPGSLQSWAGDIITILREAHQAVDEARARGSTALDPQVLNGLRERYDTAVRTGITHNRLRDWDTGNHPGYALSCWLRDYKEQVLLFTRDFAVDWTNNVSERGAKAAKRHQPHFVHFVGHGGGDEGSFAAEDDIGYAHVIPVDGLVQAFKAVGRDVRCVIVNACRTERLAQALAAVVPWVIGVRQPVGDRSAIRFSIGFYQALAPGKPVETAFDVGLAQVMMTPQGDDALAPLLLHGPGGTG